MRILSVRFKNLNSLVGEWRIDLTHPAFVSDGLFAITGPTGAGKTTVLDAISLALYGRTPRLDRIAKSANEVMSRQTGECFAEVTFETDAGRYRCHWSQHRSRRKANGELQAPKHEIAEADSGKILTTKLRGVADEIATVTGLDFKRFTRSMLLAQGEFAAFLEAPPDERSPILEQITGTQIYTDISVRVHERRRDARDALNLLKAESSGIVILMLEQEQSVIQDLDTKNREQTRLSAIIAESQAAVAWHRTIDALVGEIDALAKATQSLDAERAVFDSDRERLERAERAAALEGQYATLSATRGQQASDREALRQNEISLPALALSAQAHSAALDEAQRQTASAKAALEAAAPVLKKVRALDQTLADRDQALSDGETACRAVSAKIDASRTAHHAVCAEQAQAKATVASRREALEAQAHDEWLIGGLAGVEERVNALIALQREIAEKQSLQEKAVATVERLTHALAACQRRSSARREALLSATDARREAKEALDRQLDGRLLREYRAEKEAALRESSLLQTIASLAEHRAALEDGKPCPLCGATEHPFAEGSVPTTHDIERKIAELTEFITAAETQAARIETLEATRITARDEHVEAERLEGLAASEKNAAERALADSEASLGSVRTTRSERRRALSEILAPLGVSVTAETDLSALIDTLQGRRRAWQARVADTVALDRCIGDLDAERKRLEAIIDTQCAVLTEQQARLRTVRETRDRLHAERRALYAENDPNREEGRLNQALTDAERAERLARDQRDAHRQHWQTAVATSESLQRRIDEREPEHQRQASAFTEALHHAGFADENAYRAARVPPAQRREWAARARALDERHTELKARRADRESRLALERSKHLTDQSAAALEQRIDAHEQTLKTLRTEVAGLELKLTENAAAKARLSEKHTAIEAQTQECRRWEALHELIGSADGKRYRNFAQGLTFERMVCHANQRLRTMTDRYTLIHNVNDPLELNVMDNYQAGEVRSTKNLSGGESFIVSLALALGLSQMASRNVRVDSLFLDEGFGTLDEEALETALVTLAGLRQDGKLIGIISHVAALKERIGTQILVTPRTGGRSQLSGPGCRGPRAAER